MERRECERENNATAEEIVCCVCEFMLCDGMIRRNSEFRKSWTCVYDCTLLVQQYMCLTLNGARFNDGAPKRNERFRPIKDEIEMARQSEKGVFDPRSAFE